MAITLGAFEAKTKLSELLDRVERGEEFTITKRGRPVARLVPTAKPDEAKAADTVERLIELRKEWTLDGLSWKALRDEGRR